MTSDEPQRTERLQILLCKEELAAIDDFRFENRMPNRAAAIRELLRRGLASAKKVRTPRSN
jgi:metal-responsive CopG/Arc/MetJ family transcriptional regulator